MKTLSDALNPMGQKMKTSIQALESSLVAFSSMTEIPITFFSVHGNVLWEINREKKFCISNAEYNDKKSGCMINLYSAMKMSYRLGELYIYVCNTGLINMCYAFVYEGKLQGYFNAGPIVMGKNKEQAIAKFYSRVSQENLDIPLFLSIVSDFRLYSTKEVTYLSTMYLNALKSAFIQDNEQDINRQKMTEQYHIGMKIIEMKKSQIEMEYPLALEHKFIDSIAHTDAKVCKKRFSEYLGELMVFEGGNISVIRLRLLTLLPKILQSKIHLDYDHEYGYESISFFESINNAETFAEIISAVNAIIDRIHTLDSAHIYSGQSVIVRNAVLYIRHNFSEQINLKSVAEAIHVNHAYLSTLFKREMNKSIVDYINDLRLESASRALVQSNDSVTDIALRCGFKESSYFTKCFKEKYHVIPKEYRKQNR